MTLVVTHPFVSPKPQGGDSARIYGPQWNADHTIAGTADATQLNANVVQAVTNDTNIQGSISGQNLTFSWGGTLAAARLNANVVQAVTNDTNIHGAISAQNLTFSWSGLLGLARGGVNADLSATGGAGQYLKQVSSGAAITVGTIPASDIASGAALTKTNDTNVTLTLGGSPTTALLAATSVTLGWTGTLSIARGGTGAATQQAAFDALAPTATRAGDITYWNGTHYVNLAGNNVGTKVLQQDSSGVPSWVTVSGTGTVTSSGSPVVGQIPKFTSSTDITGIVWSVTPQGRITLTSATPVLTATVSGATTVYYTPYVGQMVPIYDGTTMIPTVFTELSQATTDTTKSPAAVAASKVYDLFVWNDSGTLRCTRGPAWSSSSSRGYTLTMQNGVLLNTSAITNGPGASRGTWVGTIASNGSSTIDYIFGAAASGGTAAVLNVWNAYNRVLTPTTVTDSGTTYTYATNTVRQARASAGNQISFVLGAQEDAVLFAYNTGINTAAGGAMAAGVGFNSTTTFGVVPYGAQTATALSFSGTSSGSWAAPIGTNILSANEVAVVGTDTFNDNTYGNKNTLSATIRN